MSTRKAPPAAEMPRSSSVLTSRPLSLIVLALLSAVVASVVYFNYYAV